MKGWIKKINIELVLLMLIGFIPLIAHLKMVPLEGEFYKRYVAGVDGDFYSYYKALILIVITTILTIIFIVKFVKKDIKIKKSNNYIYLIIYLVFILLSTFLSPDKNIVYSGFYSRYEGLFVLISYLIVFFTAFNVINNEDQVKKIIYSISISSLIIGIIGLTQFVGHDFLQSNIGKKLLIFGVNGMKPSDINFTLEKHTVYGTLVNSNYMGSFVLLILPMFLIFVAKTKNMKYRVMYIILSLIVVICLFSSRSRAGIFGAIVTLIVSIILFRKEVANKWKKILPILIFVVIMILILDRATGGTILKKYTSIYLDPRLAFNSCDLENVDIKKDTVSIKLKNETFKIKLAKDRLEIYDKEDTMIKYKVLGGKIIFDDEKYKNYILEVGMINSMPIIKTSINDIKLYFGITRDGFKFINPWQEAVDLKPVEKWGFEGKEQLGSSRGYIWSRSLPILKNTFAIGYGPDTFAVNFPQDDYIGKIKAYGTMNILVDKPHNMYLQTGINTGVISLIALLILFLIYIIQSFKIYLKNTFDDFYSIAGVGIFLGILGYLVAGIFNDSVVSVAPVFWLLFGVGVSINAIVSENRNLELKK